MRLDRLKKELLALVATIESGRPDTERLSALDDIFRLRNGCQTPNARRVFYAMASQKKILHLTRLAVDRSGKGVGTLSPGAERLMSELAVWAKEYDPGPDLAAAAIKRGDEKEIQSVVSAIIAELKCETMSERAWLASKLKQPGQSRIGALGHIVVRRRGSKTAQRYAQALFHAIRCAECSQDQAVIRCRCGCQRRLCRRCEEVDQTTEMILRELSRSTA